MKHCDDQLKELLEGQAAIAADLKACSDLYLGRPADRSAGIGIIQEENINNFETNLLEHERIFKQLSANLQNMQRSMENLLTKIKAPVLIASASQSDLQLHYQTLIVAVSSNKLESAMEALTAIRRFTHNREGIISQLNKLEDYLPKIDALKPVLTNLHLKLKQQRDLIPLDDGASLDGSDADSLESVGGVMEQSFFTTRNRGDGPGPNRLFH